MNPVIIGCAALVVLVVLLVSGINVGTVMGIIGIGGMAILMGGDVALLKGGLSPFETMNSYNYAVMPLFILMANIISSTGIGKNLYNLFYRILGRFRGGLAMATIVACAVFAAISSTTTATAITIGLIALPEMRKAGYSDTLATGSIASGGTLGVLIPPSGILIVYGIFAQQSVSDLFTAVIIPGIMMMLAFCAAIAVTCRIRPDAGPRGEKFTLKEIWEVLKDCIEVIILIVLVLGGMFIGWFTPTEAGAIGAFGSIIITLVRKKLTWKGFISALQGTLKNTGMVFFILVGALVMNYFVAVTNLPSALANLLLRMNIGPTLTVIGMIVIYLFLGCFLDSLAMILMTLPVFFPVAMAVGADPIWFGVIIAICMELSAITPPVGMNLFVTKGLDKSIKIRDVYVGVAPFIVAEAVVVAILIAFPALTTWLPSILG